MQNLTFDAGEYEQETIRLAEAGDADAGREALSLCRIGLDAGNLSRQLAAFLAARLWAIDRALDEAERLRSVKKSSGSIRSARDAAIAEALCIKKPAAKPKNPLPEWQVPYAAFGTLLLQSGMRPEAVKAKMDEARRFKEKKDGGLDRREAERILAAYRPMMTIDREFLLHLCGELREILPTESPQTD